MKRRGVSNAASTHPGTRSTPTLPGTSPTFARATMRSRLRAARRWDIDDDNGGAHALGNASEHEEPVRRRSQSPRMLARILRRRIHFGLIVDGANKRHICVRPRTSLAFPSRTLQADSTNCVRNFKLRQSLQWPRAARNLRAKRKWRHNEGRSRPIAL